MRPRAPLPTLLTVASILAAAGLCGCGLKGPLELPERASNMVIRPAPGAAGAPAPAAPGEATAPGAPQGTTPASPATGTAPATAPAEEDIDHPPPPELPRGQRGGASS